MLSLKNIDVHYGKALAVSSISIDVDEGSVVGIIGANGAGKSTILKAISNYIHVSGGEIYFNGKRIDRLPTHEIVKLGIIHVPESRHLFPYMSVLANLQLGAYLRNNRAEVRNDLEDIFERFPKLRERRNQQASTLSGGEQQLLAIARGLMSKPKLLLLDEPSIGLAPLVIAEITTVIKEINKSGISVLLVEQNAGMVTEVADRGYVLEVGKLVLEGKMKDIINNEIVRAAFLG